MVKKPPLLFETCLSTHPQTQQMKMCESCPNDSWCETPEITLNKYSGKIATFPSGVCFLCTEKRTCVQGVTEQGSGERGYPHILRQNTHCAGFSSLGQRLWSDGGQHSYDAQRFVCYLLLLTLDVLDSAK